MDMVNLTPEQQDLWDLEMAIATRGMMNHPLIGPLTRDQAEELDAYEAYHQEMEAEHEAAEAAGGRTICPQCGNRSVKHTSVITLGYAGHPGAEYSDYGKCETEGCDYAEL